MDIVAGLSLKNLKPRVWDPHSPYYLPRLKAVMVSYADFARMPALRERAMEQGLRAFLGVPKDVSIYLDNGAFYFLNRGGETPRGDYDAFISQADPDWYTIPQDYIPTPRMSDEEQRACLQQTMAVNRLYHHDGYVPVIHISRHLEDYLNQLQADQRLKVKPIIALGGIVPNLLRAPKAMPYGDILDSIRRVRMVLREKKLHIFGVGGTATLHLAALLNIDSVDSSGWRNRAARGIVQLPGCGDRVVANMGSWRGREPSDEEWKVLQACECPACQQSGVKGLKESKIQGFCNRATHNLWVLLEEVQEIEQRLTNGSYSDWYTTHINNTIYEPLINYVLRQRGTAERSTK